MTKMAGFWSCTWPRPSLLLSCSNKRIHRVHCCSVAPNGTSKGTETPQLLKIAVSGLTELLRVFSSHVQDRTIMVDTEWKDEISVYDVNDVLAIVESDYEKAYFVTGQFTSAIYAEDCTFEDPTIKFQGQMQSNCICPHSNNSQVHAACASTILHDISSSTIPCTELYARNLTLLVPFFEDPSVQLRKIEKSLDSEAACIVATWKLRTYLKLPWKPLISIDGRTLYELDEKFRIVRHVERWNVTAVEAIIQIFTPSYGMSN